MKINPSYSGDDSEAKKNKPTWQDERRRRAITGDDVDTKFRLTESPVKESTKFVSILESAAKPQKPNQAKEDSTHERQDDNKDKKHVLGDGDSSSDGVPDHDRIERNNSSFSGHFGASSGFGEGSGVNQTVNLSENFAARSILHIADLERMISVIRTQTAVGQKREVYLELKRSVMDGLRVKITTDPSAQVQITFLAANEKVRSQIQDHSEELAEILRGRGINLSLLTTAIDPYAQTDPDDNPSQSDEQAGENTFER